MRATRYLKVGIMGVATVLIYLGVLSLLLAFLSAIFSMPESIFQVVGSFDLGLAFGWLCEYWDWLGKCIGTALLAGLVLYMVLGKGGMRLVEVKASKIKITSMPLLRPKPIPTLCQRASERPIVWLSCGRVWKLEENWKLDFLSEGNKARKLVIKKGFEFDGASVPRAFWHIVNPVGLLLIPSLVHDYGYQKGRSLKGFEDMNKIDWDNLFYRVGIGVCGFRLICILGWLAVVVGGWTAWHKGQKNQGNGWV